MIDAKDITVIAPCVYQNEDPVWMFNATCRRFGITPVFYGKGKNYSGWIDIMLTQMMEAARTCPTSHMLYTDSRDAFFLAGLDEIADKYNAMGCPPLLIGADSQGFSTYQKWYDKVPWDFTKSFPYFQVGGMLCEAKALYEAIRWMFEQQWPGMPGDNPPYWCNFMATRPGELLIDHKCEIFQNCTNVMGSLLFVSVRTNHILRGGFILGDHVLRVRNTLTNSLPCILHFQGGYTDPLKGKWPTMEPIWRRLGYTENPPWER